jgi:hypothetical protein
MSQKPHADDEEAPIELGALAPRRGWIDHLPSLGREAARRRGAQDAWTAGFSAAGRWFVPLATGIALACWIASAAWRPASTASSALLLAGSEQETLTTLTLGAGR